VLAAVSPPAVDQPWGGFAQRGLGLVTVAWLGLVAKRIRANAFGRRADHRPAEARDRATAHRAHVR
jgi:hypothetical protein